MVRVRGMLAASAAVLVLAGCAPAQRPAGRVVCPGAIEIPEGFVAVDDAALLARALGTPTHGGLCEGRAYEVRTAVRVYRVWDHARPASARGRWWSLTRAQGPVDRYREQNAICPEWSALDRVSVCTLRVGARVALGPGQSATCANGSTYPASATNQLYVPNDEHLGYIVDCDEGAAWP